MEVSVLDPGYVGLSLLLADTDTVKKAYQTIYMTEYLKSLL